MSECSEVSTLELVEGILSKTLDAGFSQRPDRYPSGVTGFPVHRATMSWRFRPIIVLRKDRADESRRIG